MDKYSPTNYFMSRSDEPHTKPNRLFDNKRTSNRALLDQSENDSDLYSPEFKPVTKTIKKNRLMKRSYINTSNESRLELIEAVHTHGEKIKYAAKRLGINYSSAKAICQIYKREGRSDKKVPRRVNPNEKKACEFQENSVFTSPICDPLKIYVEEVEENEEKEAETETDCENNWTASTQESLTISKGLTSESSCLSIRQIEESIQKPGILANEEVSKLSLHHQAQSYDAKISHDINPSQHLIQKVIPSQIQPSQGLVYPQIGQLPIQQPSLYSASLNPLLCQIPQTQFLNGSIVDPTLLLSQGHAINSELAHMMKIKAQLSSIYDNIPKTKQDQGLYPDVSHLLKQSLLATQQPQIHASIYPQGLNILNSQINGLPLMTMGMAPMPFAQGIYQTAYNPGLSQLPIQANMWNSQLGSIPYNLQGYSGKLL